MSKAQAGSQQLRDLTASEVQALIDEYARFATHAQQLGNHQVGVAWGQAAQRLREIAESAAPAAPANKVAGSLGAILDETTMDKIRKIAEGRRF